MIAPTREEWLAVRRCFAAHGESDFGLTEVALGPCPPEPTPEPEPFHRDGSDYILVRTIPTPRNAHVPCWVGVPGIALTPDEADAMACALIEHARYAREQGAA